MKTWPRNGARLCRFVWVLPAVFGAAARAADTNNPPMAPADYFEGGTNTYNNWVEFSGGGFLPQGNRAAAQAIESRNSGGFGGIDDLHVQDNVFTNTTLTLDGRGIYDQHDYDVKVRLEHPQKWFLQFQADNSRTWSDGLGGFYPPTGTQYYGPDGNNPLALDRGEYSFLGGLTLDNLPNLTFQYTHSYRHGNEESTIWAPATVNPSAGTVQGLAASLYNFDETVDAFDLNAKKNLWHTDLGLGLHFEHGDLNDGLDSTFFPGEPFAEDVNASQKNTYNLFSANATGEKWLGQHVFASAGGMIANLDNNFSGSQIGGDPYGYYNLVGNSHLQEYVMDVNLLTIPAKTLEIIPSLRANKESWSGDSTGIGTLSTFPTEPFNGQSSRDVIDVCEGLELRYTGVTNWVFSVGGQWDEGQGNLNQFGGLSQVDGIGAPAVTNYTDDNSLLQKYSANASWYPLRRLALDFGGYYKNDCYNYSAPADSTPDGDTYPGYFTIQNLQTYDGNCRVTLHLLPNLSLISRYEYQLSTVDTTPDPASGLGAQQTSRMRSHIIGQNISWVPWSRLSLNAGFTYVLSTTATPASGATAAVASQSVPPTAAAVFNAENNYWTLNFSPSLVLDDKTDLNLDYFYYQADDYQDNSSGGVPLGAGSRENAVTATLTRRINPHLRVNLKYGFYDYQDALTGGNGNFKGQLIMASFQYRF